MSRFAATLALAAVTLGICAPAQAQDITATVLGIRSVEGDDDFARNLTGALRHAASQVPGWTVSQAEVSLAQMSLAFGCDEPDAACMAEISQDLESQRIIYGTVRRTGAGAEYNFALTLYLFNAESGQIEQSLTDTIPRLHVDIDDLRPHARRYVSQLAQLAQVGEVRVLVATEGASVSVDGEVVGQVDASGSFTASEVPVGRRRVEISADGYQTFRASVTVVADDVAELEVTLEAIELETTGTSIPWAGIGTLAGAGVFAILTVWTWAKISGLESDANYEAYRRAVPSNIGNVCGSAGIGGGNPYGASMDVFNGAADVCDQADTLEILQWVFLAGAVAAGGVGTWLLLRDGGDDEAEPSDTGLALRLGSQVDRHGAGVSATLQF